MTDIINLDDHRPERIFTFVGGPKDGEQAIVAGEPAVFDTSTPAEPMSPRGGHLWPREWVSCTYIKDMSGEPRYVFQEGAK